jgi:hypothetical protein
LRGEQHTLFPVLVHREAFKVDIPSRSELGLDRAGDVDGAFESQAGHVVLDDLEVDGDDAGHLDGAAERDLAVALREVEVADRELGARYVDGQVDLGALDRSITIA